MRLFKRRKTIHFDVWTPPKPTPQREGRKLLKRLLKGDFDK